MKQRDPSTKGAKSTYAKKQARKYGSGTVDPRWMSWAENPAHPRRLAIVAVMILAVFGSEARASGGSRCHESRPACGVGAEPICLCESTTASDSTCHFVCGSLGRR